MKLQSIPAEDRACRAAWAAMPDAVAGAHIHHEAPVELLTEPIENRIAYIRSEKPEAEQALRLRLMRPVSTAAWADYEWAVAPAWADYERIEDKAWAEYERVKAWAEYERVKAAAWAEYKRFVAVAHAAVCPTPDCPWDGFSIFGGKR